MVGNVAGARTEVVVTVGERARMCEWRCLVQDPWWTIESQPPSPCPWGERASTAGHLVVVEENEVDAMARLAAEGRKDGNWWRGDGSYTTTGRRCIAARASQSTTGSIVTD